MKQFIARIVIVVTVFTLVNAPITHAVENEITYTSANTELYGDDNYAGPFNLGFTFNLYGTDYTQAYVNINGTVNFGTGMSAYSNTSLASSGNNNSLYPFWDDLITYGSNKTIYYQTVGDPGSRKFIVQWTNMYFCCSTTIPMGTFQAIMYEGSNDIQFQYRDLLGGDRSLGNSATIGIKKDGSTNSQFSLNTTSVNQEQAIRYHPTSSSTYSVDSGTTYDPLYLVPSDVPVSPNLINPTNGSTNVTTTPTFEWQAVNLATSYRVLVSTISNFSSTIVNQSGITGTSYTLGSALNYGTTYYWRVEAINSNGSSFSSSRTFTTSSTPNATPNAPTSIESKYTSGNTINSTALSSIPITMSLTDSDVGDIVRSRLQIATDSSFNDLVIDHRSAFGTQGANSFNFGTSTGTYLVGDSSTTLDDGQSYYLRIRNEDDKSASSSWSGPVGVAFIYSSTTTPTAPTTPTTPVSTPKATTTSSAASKTTSSSAKTSTSSTQATTSSDQATDETSDTIPSLTVRVLDKSGTPIAGAKVTLHSVERIAYTDSDGYATFTNVERGEHHVIAEHGGQSATIPLTIDNTTQTLASIDIKLAEKQPDTKLMKTETPINYMLYVFVATGAIGLFIIFLVLKRRRKNQD